MKSIRNLGTALLCGASRLWGCEKVSFPLSMRTGRGKVGRGGHGARGRRAAPRALAGVFAAPATVHQTLHHTHQSKGVEFFIKAHELGESQVQRLLGKGIKPLL